MCGAASESILLAVAIEKKGEEEVVRKYQSTNGRKNVEQMITAQQPDHNTHINRINEEFHSYTSLIKYWRDDAAHGMDSPIGEGEAFSSLILLLRYAGFANDKWTELTRK